MGRRAHTRRAPAHPLLNAILHRHVRTTKGRVRARKQCIESDACRCAEGGMEVRAVPVAPPAREIPPRVCGVLCPCAMSCAVDACTHVPTTCTVFVCRVRDIAFARTDSFCRHKTPTRIRIVWRRAHRYHSARSDAHRLLSCVRRTRALPCLACTRTRSVSTCMRRRELITCAHTGRPYRHNRTRMHVHIV